MAYKLGSLFDGSGGFPLAGALCGIEPMWAAEVEPYPIAVTRSRFPNMRHLGDISKVNGGEIEPVDIITFGSPCQDLSVAGKRAGLKHEANGDEETTRSGLFMEAVRIIKEMRQATNGRYPTFALWENVPGAFSSNKGEDFRVVCEELIKIIEPSASMPPVPKGGWNYADSYVGDGWSLAYRVLDAQYWGVPQRRRRIYLVADFRGERAQEVLFEREGLRGYFTEGRTPWQTTPADAQESLGADDREGESGDGAGGGRQLDAVALAPVASTLRAGAGAPKHEQDFVGRLVLAIDQQGDRHFPTLTNGTAPGFQNTVAYTMQDRAGKPGGGKGPLVQKDKATSLRTSNYQYVFQPVTDTHTIDRPAVAYGTDVSFFNSLENQSPTLLARQYKDPHLVSYPEVESSYIVRRLTPTECARLQGFADWWGIVGQKDALTDEEYHFWLDVRNTHARINGKKEQDYTVKQMLTWYNKLWTDSAEYKMWGNGIALPTALYCMQGATDALDREETEEWML